MLCAGLGSGYPSSGAKGEEGGDAPRPAAGVEGRERKRGGLDGSGCDGDRRWGRESGAIWTDAMGLVAGLLNHKAQLPILIFLLSSFFSPPDFLSKSRK